MLLYMYVPLCMGRSKVKAGNATTCILGTYGFKIETIKISLCPEQDPLCLSHVVSAAGIAPDPQDNSCHVIHILYPPTINK